MHDAILTAMYDMVIPRVEMAAKLITHSSGNGDNSTIRNPDRRDFTWNTEISPLRSASSRLELNIEQDEIDETRDIDNQRTATSRQQDLIVTGGCTLITDVFQASSIILVKQRFFQKLADEK